MDKEKISNTPWKWVGHSWSDESVYDADGNVVCTASISNEATEATQVALEAQMSANMKFIASAPEIIAADTTMINKLLDVMEALCHVRDCFGEDFNQECNQPGCILRRACKVYSELENSY